MCVWVLGQVAVYSSAPTPALTTFVDLLSDTSLPHLMRESICYGVAGIQKYFAAGILY